MSQALCSRMNPFYELSFYVVSLLILFFSGPFFLAPYYAINEGEVVYNGPTKSNWKPGSYLLSLKVLSGNLTWMSELSSRYTLTLNSGFQTAYLNDSLETCPPRFQKYWPYILDYPCAQIFEQPLQFLITSQKYDTLLNVGNSFDGAPEAVHQHFYHFSSPIESDHVVDPADQFVAAPANSEHTNSIRAVFDSQLWVLDDSLSCLSDEECFSFFSELKRKSSLPFTHEYRCHPQHGSWKYTGCAARIQIGNETQCYGNYHASTVNCYFGLFYLFFDEPPQFFQMLSLWSWGFIAFVETFFLLLFFTLLLIHGLHVAYIHSYYFTRNSLNVKKNFVYEWDLRLIGEQFTHETGDLILSHKNLEVPIFSHRLVVDFTEEDSEGSREGVVDLSGEFVASIDCPGATLSVKWENEFLFADFVPPRSYIAIRQKIPPGLSSKWSIVLMPILACFNLLPCRRRMETNQPLRFALLILQVMLFHISWLVILLFTVQTSTTSAWGMRSHRSPVSLIYYFAFLFVIVSQMVCGIISRIYGCFQDRAKQQEELLIGKQYGTLSCYLSRNGNIGLFWGNYMEISGRPSRNRRERVDLHTPYTSMSSLSTASLIPRS